MDLDIEKASDSKYHQLHKKSAEFLKETIIRAEGLAAEYKSAGLESIAGDMKAFATKTFLGCMAFSIMAAATSEPAPEPKIPEPNQGTSRPCNCHVCLSTSPLSPPPGF